MLISTTWLQNKYKNIKKQEYEKKRKVRKLTAVELHQKSGSKSKFF